MVILNENTITNIDSEFQALTLYNYAIFTSFLTQNGGVKKFNYHLKRLERDCLTLFGISPTQEIVRKNIRTFLTHFDNLKPVIVRVTVFPKQFSLAHPGDIKALNILVTGRSYNFVNRKTPLKLLVVDTQRTMWAHKTTNLMANLKARAIAQSQKYDDALLSNGHLITEGVTWNIFFLQGKKIITPPIEDGLLPGITRKILVENISQIDIELTQESVPISTLKHFNGCLITNAAIGISVVGSIDKYPYETESSVIKQIKELYISIPFETI
jgi:branched-subunit amino acid aminotransferase/4-amino-4-deoxychorismate lyase